MYSDLESNNSNTRMGWTSKVHPAVVYTTLFFSLVAAGYAIQ
jgi:hypothetical protein